MPGDFDLSVIGLGAMGAAIAKKLIGDGYKVAIWNRTPARTEDVVAAGGTAVASPAEAIASSPITFMCVIDYSAADAILAGEGVESVLAGKTLVQCSTGKLSEVVAQSARVRSLGGSFIACGIMAGPERLGSDECMVLYSGGPGFAGHSDLLHSLGGSSRFLGADAAQGIAMYFALGSFLTGAQTMFFEAAALVRSFDLPIELFHDLSGPTMQELGASIASGVDRIKQKQYGDSQGTVDAYRLAMIDVAQSYRAAGVNPRLVEATVGHLQKATEAGCGSNDVSNAIEFMEC